MTVTQKKRGKSDKSPPIFSHEFVRKNHGDIFAMIVSALIFGNVMQTTKAMFQPFIRPAHNVSSLSNEVTFNFPIYSTGLKDLLLLVTYICGAVVITCIVNEQIADRFLTRFHLSLTRSWKCRHSLHQLCYSLPLLVAGVYTLFHENTVSALFKNFKKYPQSPFSLCTKIFFLYAIGFQICMLMKIYLIKFRKEIIPKAICTYVAHAAFLSYLYLMNMSQIGMLVVVVIAAFELMIDLAKLVCILICTHKTSKTIVKMCSYVFFVFFALFIVSFSLYFIVGIGPGSEFSLFFEKQYPHISTLSLRLIGVAVVVGELFAQLLQFLSIWHIGHSGVLFSLKQSDSSMQQDSEDDEEDSDKRYRSQAKKSSQPVAKKGSAVVIPRKNPPLNKKKKLSPKPIPSSTKQVKKEVPVKKVIKKDKTNKKSTK